MKFLYLLIFVGCAVYARLPTIAVLDFNASESALLLGPGFEETQSQVRGDVLAGRLAMYLKQSHKFTLVDRAGVQHLFDEKELIKTRAGDMEEAAKIGKLLSARYLVFGVLESLEARIDERPVPYSKKYVTQTAYAHMAVQIHITDSLQGRIVAHERVQKDISGPLPSLKTAFLESLKEAVVKEAVAIITEAVYPMRIVDVDSGSKTAYVNSGSGGRLKVGDLLGVYQELGDLIDPETNRLLGTKQKLICRVRVTEIHDAYSVVSFDGDCPMLPEAALCKPLSTQ